MRRADRLMKIAHFLRSRRRAVTAQRIAEEFEICKRTVYRDIQTLVSTGVPIIGEAGVGYVIDKGYYLPPVTFDVDELEALGLGISMVCQWTDESFAEKAESALDKIRAVLPKELQGDLEQLTTYSMPQQSDLPWEVSLSRLRRCIRERKKVEITYQDELQRTTVRTVRPLALIFASPIWLLASWCEKRTDFRNFRLDRMHGIVWSEQPFEDEEDKNLSAYKAQDGIC